MDSAKRTFLDVCKKFDQAILVAGTEQGSLISCPLLVASVNDFGEFWFVTQRSHSLEEAVHGSHEVSVNMASSGEFLSLIGTIVQCKEPERVAELWNERWRSWFPEGVQDHSFTALIFDAKQGEYWSSSVATRLKHFFPATKECMCASGS